ncbi:MAG: 4Fe-4S binding protein [Oscillospiraceae bacterium]|nr:4Fe-4S binding protein [Oscillospiraceae bacterium]
MVKKKKRPGKIRLLIQCAFGALSNGHLIGFKTGKIYTGALKVLCAPGMNCYSCPGALGACPIGALQAVLNSKQYHIALYVFGFMTVMGTFFGRLICGFLCPFGLVQDIIHKIPTPKKVRKLPGEVYWRWLRFVLLGVFVILLPMIVHNLFGIGDPWFCKYICPVGTLEAGVPLVLLNPALKDAIGWHYAWKIAIAVLILVASAMIYRPFCRYLCPLGAIYGLFNRFAIYRYHIDTEKCVGCGACQSACKLEIPVWKKPNSMDCIRCGECRHACPTGAIKIK